MAKTKTKSHRSRPSDSVLHQTSAHIKTPTIKSTATLLLEAADFLSQSQPDAALPLATECLRRLQSEQPPPANLPNEQYVDSLLRIAAEEKPVLPQAVVLVAEVHLARGDASSAVQHFEAAVRIDPDGALVSADPYLYLAQLCEEGGAKSIQYFERGCEVLRNEIEVLNDSIQADDEEGQLIIKSKQAKLAEALCGMTEVYMTDLSFEEDAEQKCENYITEAVAVCPDELSAGTLQVLASVRISQERLDEAKEALSRSIAVWKDIPLEVESDSRPDFAMRVSLSRLLMEVEMLEDATKVIEGLIRDDDESVESWYLGGWCQILVSQKATTDQTSAKEKAKTWLDTCLRLYQIQEYEDDRLRDHALELRQGLKKDLGIDNDEDDWEDEDEDSGDSEVEVLEDDDVNGSKGDRDGDVDMT
jgi:tetratricopeptide (TPR) repeat protein